MNFEGISFNEEHWKTKTEAEFIAGESHHGLSEKQLKEAYAIMVPKKVVEKKEPIKDDSKGPIKESGAITEGN